MTLKTVLAAAILAATPTFALAMGGCDHGKEQVSTCADGFTWDRQAGTCVEQTTS